MTADTPARRPVDAVCDQYVEDLAALDPIAATYAGIAGHDHELPDLSPTGSQAGEALTRAAIAAARAATPTDERERVAQDAFLERLGLEQELAEARLLPVRLQRDQQRPARPARGLRPDAHRGRGGVEPHRRPARRHPGGTRGLPHHAARRGRQGPGLRRAAVHRGGRAGPQLDRPGGRRAATCSPPSWPTPTCRRRSAPSCVRTRPTRRAAYADFGRFLTDELAPRGRGEGGRRAGALRPGLALLPRRRGRPRRRPTPGAGTS